MTISTQLGYAAAYAALGCSLLSGQSSTAASGPVTVFRSEGDVSAPKLLPNTFTAETQSACEKPFSGVMTLATIVDASGRPRNTMFVHPAGNDLDKLALGMLAAKRFTPGEKNGAPVAVSQTWR